MLLALRKARKGREGKGDVHQRVRKPHFCPVHQAISHSLDESESIVVAGVEDDALDARSQSF